MRPQFESAPAWIADLIAPESVEGFLDVLMCILELSWTEQIDTV